MNNLANIYLNVYREVNKFLHVDSSVNNSINEFNFLSNISDKFEFFTFFPFAESLDFFGYGKLKFRGFQKSIMKQIFNKNFNYFDNTNQTGISNILLLYIVYYSFINENKIIYIKTDKIENALVFIDKLKHLFLSVSKIYGKISFEIENPFLIKLSNGSKIEFLYKDHITENLNNFNLLLVDNIHLMNSIQTDFLNNLYFENGKVIIIGDKHSNKFNNIFNLNNYKFNIF